MAISCLLGLHAWKGCQCAKCGKTRGHDWRSDCQRCAHCEAARTEPHRWNGCKCSACGKSRAEEHDWSGDCEKCRICGTTRQAAHAWDGCKCKVCGKAWDLNGVLKPLGTTSDVSQAEALGKLYGNPCTPALVDSIAGHLALQKENEVRRGAAVALGILGDASAVSALCRALDVDKESLFLLSDLAEALRNIADRNAAEPLMRWLVSLDAYSQKMGNQSRSSAPFERDTVIQRFLRGKALEQVIHALGVMRVQEATSYLIGALQDSEHIVSEAGIEALGEMGSFARPLLESVLADPSLISERRCEAVDALGASDDPAAVPALLKALEDSDSSVGNYAFAALGRMTDQRAFESVVAFLEGSDQGRASNAAYHLGDFGDARAIEPLRKALGSTDQKTRLYAAQALAKLGDQSGADILAECLGDGKALKDVIASLGMLGDPRAYEPLTRMLSSKEESECGGAAQSLGRLGDHRAIPSLVNLLADSRWFVHLSAAAGLAMLGDLRGFNTLMHGLWLSGFCDHHQLAAIEALGRSGDERAMKHLVRALRGARKKARRPIAKALARFGTAATDALLSELTDARPIVRLHAVEALATIGDGRAADKLTNLARDDADKDVRAAATVFAIRPVGNSSIHNQKTL
jgi:HEAT repeat protein